MTQISVIIPVFNEAANLPATLTTVQAAPVEIIVVDGGSQDNTREVAAQLGAIVLDSAPGRAAQMNAGATIAQGNVLLFLHADTMLPLDYTAHIERVLAKPGIVAGAFELNIAGTQSGLRWVEWGVKWRSRLLQMPYGDQGIFLAAATFHQLGGFPELPIMEDFVFVRRLKALGRVAIAPAAVLTSGRRWQKLGVVKTTLTNQLLILSYFLGVAPTRLAQWYRRLR